MKRGRPWKRWTDEAEENYDNMGIKKLVYSDQRQEGMMESVLIAKVHNRP